MYVNHGIQAIIIFLPILSLIYHRIKSRFLILGSLKFPPGWWEGVYMFNYPTGRTFPLCIWWIQKHLPITSVKITNLNSWATMMYLLPLYSLINVLFLPKKKKKKKRNIFLTCLNNLCTFAVPPFSFFLRYCVLSFIFDYLISTMSKDNNSPPNLIYFMVAVWCWC